MEKKLQDYLPYYLGVDYWTNNSQGNLNAYTLPNVIDMCERNKNVQLHLRNLNSMSWDEWAEVREQLSADIVRNAENVRYKDKPYWVIVLENRVNTNTLRLNDGLVLIRLGYDVFNLIESGLAIDASTLTK